jgi:hypothetical protein
MGESRIGKPVTPKSFARRRLHPLGAAVVMAGALCGQAARASEGGASFYLLGSGGPGAATLPPLEGIFLVNTFYYYNGKGGGNRQFSLGGNLVAGVKAEIFADFPTVIWVPTTNLAGGVLALGAIAPVADVNVDVSAVITGPRGNSLNLSRSDDAFTFGDPALTAMLGWKTGKLAVTASTLVNIPIGDYRAGHLANIAFHRWAVDTSLAATWRDPKNGWDVSGKAGFTFNGTNDTTDYNTGTEFHLEGAIEKTLSPAFSLGVQGYYFDQVSGDSGSGATLGSFKGQVAGLGVTGAYNFKIMGKVPASLRLRALTEFDAKNRMEGDAVFLDFSMPLAVKMPPGAPPP